MSRRAVARHSSPDSFFRSGACPSRRRNTILGPQAPQAIASAWKRRSPGSVYSASHAAHIGNGAIVVFAVIRDFRDYRKARPAMRAIGEGIVGAPFARIRDFRGASATDGGVRGDLRMRAPLDARRDPEVRGHIPATFRAFDAVDPRQYRRLLPQAVKENGNLLLGAPQPNKNSLGVVKNFAAKAQRARKSPDRRAEPHALHAAPHTKLQRNDLGRVPLLLLGEHCLTPSLARHPSQVERKWRMSSLSESAGRRRGAKARIMNKGQNGRRHGSSPTPTENNDCFPWGASRYNSGASPAQSEPLRRLGRRP